MPSMLLCRLLMKLAISTGPCMERAKIASIPRDRPLQPAAALQKRRVRATRRSRMIHPFIPPRHQI
jgi:hypothetical protein